MTFIPREKPQGKTRWELTPEEWRLLGITFVGGVASILVGAGAIGAAIAAGRLFVHGGSPDGSFFWGSFIFLTVFAWGFTAVAFFPLRGRIPWKHPLIQFVMPQLVGICVMVLLTWIGIAAGVH